METRIVERAVGGNTRLAAAAHSLASWYRTQQFRLRRERELYGEEMSRRQACGEDVSDLTAAFAENRVEQERLDLGWRNSSLRRAVTERAVDPAGGEQRSIISTSAAPWAGERAAGTSTVTTAKQLVGHAAVFGRWAEIGGSFRERIAPGAFASAIKTSDVRFLFNHDPNFIYGRNTANTLELHEDRIGLAFTCYLLPFDSASYGLARRVDRRDITGCSFSFSTKRDSWKLATKPGDVDERTIEEVAVLYDVACVVYPAYSQTSVEVVWEKSPARSAPAPGDAFDDDPVEPVVRSISSARQRQLVGRLDGVQARIEAHRARARRVATYGLTPAIRRVAESW